MKRLQFIGLTMLAVLSHTGTLDAQQPFGQPYQRPPVTNAARAPAVSPYLNLNRGGSPAVNYYGLVRPQLDTNQSIQQLQTQLGQTPLPAEAQAGVANQSVTGLVPQFFNFSHYFPQTTKTGGGNTAGQQRR